MSIAKLFGIRKKATRLRPFSHLLDVEQIVWFASILNEKLDDSSPVFQIKVTNTEELLLIE